MDTFLYGAAFYEEYIRQNMDSTNPDFLRYAERVIRKIAEHYRDNRAIIGYQIDNETTSYGTGGSQRAGWIRRLPAGKVRQRPIA